LEKPMLLYQLLLTICFAQVAGEIAYWLWITRDNGLEFSKEFPGTLEEAKPRFELAMVTKEGFAKTINAGGPPRIC
jgi:hypothetical protein